MRERYLYSLHHRLRWFLIFSGILLVFDALQAEAASLSGAGSALPVPKLTLHKTINLGLPEFLGGVGWSSCITSLAFSPNSRYLAILDNPSSMSGALIIWDLVANREQARIKRISPYFGIASLQPIQWSPDGNSVSAGASDNDDWKDDIGSYQMTLWDPTTGKPRERPYVAANICKFNRDGTELATFSAMIGKTGAIRVYDTNTWAYKEYPSGGIEIDSICWTSTNKVFVAGTWNGGALWWDKAHLITKVDELTPKESDIVGRLIDPSGQKPSHSVVLAPSIPSGVERPPFDPPPFEAKSAETDYRTNRIIVGDLNFKVLDGESLKIVAQYQASNEILRAGKTPRGPIRLSADGSYVFIMGSHPNCSEQSFIFDAQTAQLLGTCPGGFMGFSLSPDGKLAAMAGPQSIKIYLITTR